jgi:fructuronate reductase
VVADLVALVDPSATGWVDEQVDFATSMVDRITPATTDEDRALVAAAQGYGDAAPVPTEPYAEWVVAGRFRAGRPAWDEAGARLVEDVTPYEQRKLWLLNGAHSLLAYAGSIRGHATIDEAIADPRCRGWVETFWDEAALHLVLPADAVVDYRRALLERFANPRVRHLLAQIAPDGSIKLPVRIVPALRAERAEGRMPVGCATVLAAWVLHLRGQGAPLKTPSPRAWGRTVTWSRPSSGSWRSSPRTSARRPGAQLRSASSTSASAAASAVPSRPSATPRSHRRSRVSPPASETGAVQASADPRPG